MKLIELLGIASFAFVVWFTYRAYTSKTTPGQTPRQSIAEAWLNILIGFAINFCVNIIIIPIAMDGGHMSLANNFWMGWVYTVISILRQYAIRRWFNSMLTRAAAKIAGAA